MASVMPVVVYPPDEDGGRRGRVDGEILGRAYGLRVVPFEASDHVVAGITALYRQGNLITLTPIRRGSAPRPSAPPSSCPAGP